MATCKDTNLLGSAGYMLGWWDRKEKQRQPCFVLTVVALRQNNLFADRTRSLLVLVQKAGDLALLNRSRGISLSDVSSDPDPFNLLVKKRTVA